MYKPLKNLPANFREEEKQLLSHGINNWFSIKSLTNDQLSIVVKNSLATTRNLKRLRGMANLICEINLSQPEAALLLHAGIPSTKVLASLTPQELMTKTSRLERQLRTGENPYLTLTKALDWIKSAKRANSELTQ